MTAPAPPGWRARLRAALTPRRTIWPTRDGAWALGAAVAIGFAAMNTGNNLLYLLASLLLAVIIVSGILSEQSMRRLRLAAVLPEDIHAGRPALLGARVANRKRWLASYSLRLETPGGPPLGIERLGAGQERLLAWEATFPARGRHRLSGVRVTTRFPFGLFVKAGRLLLAEEVLVYPALAPLTPERRRQLAAGGPLAARRRGRGHDLYNLREYRSGDDPRLIHWRSSAKTGALTVRELEADTSADTRIVLEGTGTGSPERRERALSEAASLAVHLLGSGAAVELAGPGVFVPLGRGRAQRRRLLAALALWQAGRGAAEPVRRGGRMREIAVVLG